MGWEEEKEEEKERNMIFLAHGVGGRSRKENERNTFSVAHGVGGRRRIKGEEMERMGWLAHRVREEEEERERRWTRVRGY